MLQLARPLAITMWDFSWLERRWPGAGYEEWDEVLDGLCERGYEAVRIEAYPQLVAADPFHEWTLFPVWDQLDWGSPARIHVRVQPALNQFLRKCRERGLRVALSSWYREDSENRRMAIRSPRDMAEIWIKTLRTIAEDGLLDTLLWVDLCNEWPGALWAPYFENAPPELTWGGWYTDVSMRWMQESLARVREVFPGLALCYSFDGMDDGLYAKRDLKASGFDLIEHHCWMAKENDGEFAKLAGYTYGRFLPQDFVNLAERGERLYAEKPAYWQELLTKRIASLAAASRLARLPLATTECWGLVDFKDWPGMNWDYVKELCALGVETAAATGRWSVMATSNFCGPQFVGMWRDKAWHQRLTQVIKHSTLDAELNPRTVNGI